MPNTPPQLVRTAAGAGWTNPTKITGTSGQAFRALAPSGVSPALQGTNCGFSIPAGAVIAGVIVTATVQAEADFELGYSLVQLINGAAIGTAKSDPGAVWRAAGSTLSYGSATDLWGAALTPAIVNSATFGFTTVVQNFSFSNPEAASVNAYTMQIFYSFGGGGGMPSNGGIPAPLNQVLIPAQIQANQFSFYTLDPTNFNDPNSGSFYNWKVEDGIAGRTPTVNRAIISYHDLGVATFTLTITGTDDSGAVVSSSVPVTVGTAKASGRIATKVIGITRTGQNLQASVTRTPGSGPLSITKLRLEGIVEKTTY